MNWRNPDDDGVTHINIYSKGKTDLGRRLSNFAFTPIITTHGKFASVEGYWFWLKSDPQFVEERKYLRTLHGVHAKRFGGHIPKSPKYNEERFKNYIGVALRIKVVSHRLLLHDLANSTLPFAHYYVKNGQIGIAGHEWLTEEWEIIRQEVKDRKLGRA